MKTTLITVLGIILGASEVLAAPVKELSTKPLSRIWSEWSEDRKSVKILAEAVYTNKCFMDKEIYKSKAAEGAQIHYRVYRYPEGGRNCIKLYQPVGYIHTVDEISVEDFNKVGLITVNGVALANE